MSKITTKWIADTAVTKDKLNSDVVGAGLSGAAGSALAVKKDTTGGANIAKVINVNASNGVGVLIDDVTIKEVGGQLVAAGCTEKVLMHKITSGETTAGYFELGTDNPSNYAGVRCDVVGGPMQVNKLAMGATLTDGDFTIVADAGPPAKSRFYFKEKDGQTNLTEELDTDDVLIIRYEL